MALPSTISMFLNHRKDELDCVNCYGSSKIPLEEFVLEMKKTCKTRFLTPSYCRNPVVCVVTKHDKLAFPFIHIL